MKKENKPEKLVTVGSIKEWSLYGKWFRFLDISKGLLTLFWELSCTAINNEMNVCPNQFQLSLNFERKFWAVDIRNIWKRYGNLKFKWKFLQNLHFLQSKQNSSEIS
jgi:hypothetical protein